MKIGTTTFGFRYRLLDRARSPSLRSVVEQARGYGLDVLQICENARPMELSETEWQEVIDCAAQIGIELQLGCKTTESRVLQANLDRAARMPARFLRIVFEKDGEEPLPLSRLRELLDAVWPTIERTGVKLAIENHFDIPSRVLADAALPYPVSQIGFCVDTANSLRNFEPAQTVLDLLNSRAFCYHLKDFRVDGDQLGFRVSGARLGEGHLDLDCVLERILDRMLDHPQSNTILVENWVPATGVEETDVREDEAWLRHGVGVLRERLKARGVA